MGDLSCFSLIILVTGSYSGRNNNLFLNKDISFSLLRLHFVTISFHLTIST